MNTVRGHSQMTSVKFSEFWTPSLPLVSTKSTQPPFLWSEFSQPLPPPLCWRHLWMVPYHAMHYSDLNPKFYFLPVLSRRWNRLRLFCKEALVAIKSYQELRESLDSMQDVLEVCSKTVDDSSNDESTLQVGLMFFNIAYVLPSQEPLAASFFVH